MTRALAGDEEHEAADLSFQGRIRSLHWVSAKHLGAPLFLKAADVRAELDKAALCKLFYLHLDSIGVEKNLGTWKGQFLKSHS